MRRRNILAAFGIACLSAGCGRNPSMRTLEMAVGSSFGNRSSFDPDYPEKLPYASMAVQLPNIQRALVVLAKVENDEMHWYSADRGVLVTRYGRLIRTVGFPDNLAGTSFAQPDFLAPDGVPAEEVTYRRQLDIVPGNRFGVPVQSVLRLGADTEMQLGKRVMRLRLIEEHCRADALHWSFINRFWVDADRFVWRSEQHVAPGMSAFSMEITKPYRAG